MNGYAKSFAGIPIIEHPYLPSEFPKLKLMPDVPVSDEFRAEMDAWLLMMFGTEKVCFMIGGSIFSSPNNVVILKGIN